MTVRFTLIECNGNIEDGCTQNVYDGGEDVFELLDLLNSLNDKNEQLQNRIDDWHQRTFKAHEYFNILEKTIDEVCDDDISNEIWKEYEKREKLVE